MKSKNGKSWDDLEVFTAKGAKIGTPTVSIAPPQYFTFNAGFVHAGKLMNYTHVILAYSPKNEAIAFQFTNADKAKGALKLTKGGNISFGSIPFFKYNFLDTEKYKGNINPKERKFQKLAMCG